MNKQELQAILDRLPPDAEVYVRVGADDAWPAKARAFESTRLGGAIVLYLEPTEGTHRNFPEGRGVSEIVLE